MGGGSILNVLSSLLISNQPPVCLFLKHKPPEMKAALAGGLESREGRNRSCSAIIVTQRAGYCTSTGFCNSVVVSSSRVC